METKNKTFKLIVTGHDGTFECLSNGKQLHEIKNVSGEKLKFHTFCYSKQNNTIIWLAGSKGQIAHLVMEH